MIRLPIAAPLLFVLALAATPVAWAQTAVTTQLSGSGNPVDPSKNVLDALLAAVTRLNDLISAYHKRQDDLRDTESKFQNAMRNADTQRLSDLREADTRRLNELREAETRRIDQLSLQKQTFDLELARVIRAGVDGSALLLATQVKELKTDSSERTAKLEQFANEQRGRTSAGNEVWALIGVIVMLLLVGLGLMLNVMKNHREVLASANRREDYSNGNGNGNGNGYPPPRNGSVG